MRLIDADALYAALMEMSTIIARGTGRDCLALSCKAAAAIVQNAPTIDAVQVVRCKDCTEYEPDEDGDPGGCCTNTAFWMPEDGYCSDGERKAEP